ncbi:hydroxyacylglutathione hydrolase [Pseudomaricurvus sp. HS19]|nr:hydroxyacylglutathione hydrolase [Pseudomaricurvus sp. HS19]
MRIIPVPAFADNYLWLFHQAGENLAYVVDPGDAAPVEAALSEHNLQLAGILVTHHHADHIGGVEALCRHWQVPVYGPESANIPQVTDPVAEGEALSLAVAADGTCVTFDVLEVPGHTLDHIAYFSAAEAIAFVGDTLFVGGCGRMFEGTPSQMQASLQKLRELPSDTRIYCAHEYTQANYRFAEAVEGDNPAVIARVAEVAEAREQQQATVPSLLQQELETNPFLRWDSPAVVKAAEQHCHTKLATAAEIFGALRRWKDNF